MQRVHLLCLILAAVCVVIMCVGIGIGIRFGKDNTDIEYDENGDDYVKDPSVSVAGPFGGAIRSKSPDQGTTERFLKYRDSFMTKSYNMCDYISMHLTARSKLMNLSIASDVQDCKGTIEIFMQEDAGKSRTSV